MSDQSSVAEPITGLKKLLRNRSGAKDNNPAAVRAATQHVSKCLRCGVGGRCAAKRKKTSNAEGLRDRPKPSNIPEMIGERCQKRSDVIAVPLTRVDKLSLFSPLMRVGRKRIQNVERPSLIKRGQCVRSKEPHIAREPPNKIAVRWAII